MMTESQCHMSAGEVSLDVVFSCRQDDVLNVFHDFDMHLREGTDRYLDLAPTLIVVWGGGG